MPLGKRSYTKAFGGRSFKKRKVARTASWAPTGYKGRYNRGRKDVEYKAWSSNINYGSYNSGDASIPFTNAWDYTPIVTMAAGDAIDQRDGAKIRLQSLMIRIMMQNLKSQSGNTGLGTIIARFMVVYDKYPNGANLSAGCSEVMDVAAFHEINGMMNLNNRYRFKVLCDKSFQIDPAQNFGPNTNYNLYFGQNNVKHWNKYIKLRGLPSIFNSTAAGPGSVAQGQLYLMWTATTGAGYQDDAVGFSGTFRLRYTG